jgi:hypothetical protein
MMKVETQNEDQAKLQDISVLYGTSDEFETNPNILRAEAMALATPVSNKYSDEIYGALKNVESTCAVDYKTLCADYKIVPSADSAQLLMKKRMLQERSQRELLMPAMMAAF